MKKHTEFEKERIEYLKNELKEYENRVGHMAADERKGLRKWVASGNSAYNNPYYISCEDGGPMDYISAMRVTEEMHTEILASRQNGAVQDIGQESICVYF